MGPYTIGKLSDAFGLRTAMLLGLASNLAAIACLLVATRHLPRDESSLLARAERARSEA